MRALLVFLCVIAIAGCSSPESKLVGTWDGSANIQRTPSGNAALDKELANLSNVVDYSLTLNKDKTYSEKVGADAVFKDNIGINLIKGKWTFNQGTLTLTPLTVNGQDPAVLRKQVEDTMQKLHIVQDLPEGEDGPRQAMVSADFTSISMPSIGTTADLRKTQS